MMTAFRPIRTFLLLFVCSVAMPALAKSPSEARGSKLSGHATLAWKHARRSYRFDQAISVRDAARSERSPAGIFETLDDFGNTVLRIEFFDDQVLLVAGSEGQKVIHSSQFGKVLSLPLSREEFIAYLFNRIPSQPDLDVKRNPQGRILSVKKKSKKKAERYQVSFSDYRLVGGHAYPFSIEFSSGKTKLHLAWQSVLLSE